MAKKKTTTEDLAVMAQNGFIRFTIIFFSFLVLAHAGFSYAQSPDLQSLIEELRAKVESLQKQVQELKTQLAETGIQPIIEKGEETEAPLPLPALEFTTPFGFGSRGDDVRALQTFLSQFSDIYPEGLVTGFFGSLTEKAVQKFQEKHGVVSSGSRDTTGFGFVGPRTREKLREIFSSRAGLPLTPPPSSATTTPTEGKIIICHLPPGNPENKHTLEIDEAALPAHMGHGDTTGACGVPPAPPPTATTTPPTTPSPSATTTPPVATTTPPTATTTPPTAPPPPTTTPPPSEPPPPPLITPPPPPPPSPPATSTTTISYDFFLYVHDGAGGGVSSKTILTPGSPTTFGISWGISSGSQDDSYSVVFDASGIPTEATYSFSPSSCVTPCETKITITTTSATPAGTYPVTVTGTRNGVSRNTTVTVNIPSPSPHSPLWIFTADSSVGGSSPALAADGSIYINSSGGTLYALTPSGSQKWAFNMVACSYTFASPVIGSDGTIYIGCSAAVGSVYAINPDGTKKWVFTNPSNRRNITSSVSIGIDGTIYVPTYDYLYAVTPEGVQKMWGLPGNTGRYPVTIGTNGTVYVPMYQSPSAPLYALNADGTIKWSLRGGPDTVVSAVALDAAGTLYFSGSDENLYAVNPDGSIKWTFTVPNGIRYPLVASDGTIYLGSGQHGLYAIKPDGTQKWNFAASGYTNDIVLGADGTIYVGTDDGAAGAGILYAIDISGNKKWEISTHGSSGSGMVIGSDGTLYFGSARTTNKVYAVPTGAQGGSPSNAPWPRKYRNNRNTNSINDPVSKMKSDFENRLASILESLSKILKTIEELKK